MKLNCDLGESFGSYSMGLDSEAMPHIDLANIACGFHAGDPTVMQRTLALAKQHGVTIGAHPSYPDLQGFGRRSMRLSPEELANKLHYQIGALEGMARVQGLTLAYVKPHGALYNDMMADETILDTVMRAVAAYPSELKLMLLATRDAERHREQAQQQGLELLLEAFADRRYDDRGHLLSRQQPGAVLSRADMLSQVAQLVNEGSVTTHSGQVLQLNPDTLCVHGDNPEGISAIREIRALCHGR